MDNINDGGPAFPVMDTSQNAATGETTVHQFIHPGLTKRELFAAIAMHTELMTCGVPGEACDAMLDAASGAGREPADHMAHNAVECADALLRALAEPQPEPEPKWPEFNVYAADPAQRDAMRTLQTRTWFEQLPAHLRIYVNDAVDAIARTEAGEDDIPF